MWKAVRSAASCDLSNDSLQDVLVQCALQLGWGP